MISRSLTITGCSRKCSAGTNYISSMTWHIEVRNERRANIKVTMDNFREKKYMYLNQPNSKVLYIPQQMER